MKIVQIGNYPLDTAAIRGGVEASLFGLANALAKQNEVEVISVPNRTIPADQVVSHNNIHIHHLSNPYHFHSLNFFRTGAICSIIQQFKANVVHIHSSSLLCLLLIFCLRRKKIYTVVTIHGIFHVEMWKNFKRKKSVSNFLTYIIYSFFEYLVVWSAPKIIVDTWYVADALSKIRKRKYHVIPQGIDEAYFTLRDDYQLNQLISIGSISSRKGHEYLIRSVAQLKPDFPDIRLQIIGTLFSEEHRAYYASLLEIIHENNLDNYVSILTCFPEEKLHQALAESFLFVLHSHEESQGIAICEAMAAGKPVVATQVGGIPYVVQDKINGFLSAFGDVDTFSNNIRELLLHPDRRNLMGNESRKLTQQYSWKAIAFKIMEEVYRESIIY
jgi:glycosyltransferase involved in cell wall biosynthesis